MRRRTAVALLSITGLLVLALSNPAGEWWTALQQPYQSEDLIKCACDKCIPEGDDWFMAHLNQTIHPFLTPQSNLSAKDFLWWKVNAINIQHSIWLHWPLTWSLTLTHAPDTNKHQNRKYDFELKEKSGIWFSSTTTSSKRIVVLKLISLKINIGKPDGRRAQNFRLLLHIYFDQSHCWMQASCLARNCQTGTWRVSFMNIL